MSAADGTVNMGLKLVGVPLLPLVGEAVADAGEPSPSAD